MTDKSRTGVEEAIAKFPATFGLRAFPGRTFRISPRSSYWNGTSVQLVTQVADGDGWLDFARGEVEELKREVVVL